MLTTKEFHRQIIHIILGLFIVIGVYLEIVSSLSIFLLIVVGVLASIVSKRIYLPVFSDFIGLWERDGVKSKFPGKGMIFYLVGALLVLQLFERRIALAAIMVLAFGDSVSHIVGGKYGKLRNIFNWKSNKLLEGTIAGIFAGFLGAWVFVPFSWAFLGAAGAMIAEVVKIDFNEKSLDDNIVVPLIAGTVMFLIGKYVHLIP
jgi:dolichol kinase